ncbi:unnamed protein product [Caenorhabditis nigoni]
MSSASEASWQLTASNDVLLADSQQIQSSSKEASSLRRIDQIPCHPSRPGSSLQIGLLIDSSLELWDIVLNLWTLGGIYFLNNFVDCVYDTVFEMMTDRILDITVILVFFSHMTYNFNERIRILINKITQQ